jgi:DNA-binding MarR family transcriptional regulator
MVKNKNLDVQRLDKVENTRGDELEFFSDPNFELWITFIQTGDVLTKAREMELNQFQLTKAQAEIIHRLLHKNTGLTISDISRWNGKEFTSVLTLINRMEKNGLIEKSRSGTRTNILVTEKGKNLYTRSTRKSIDMIFSILSADEKQQLRTCVTKLREKGRELLGMDFKPPFLNP